MGHEGDLVKISSAQPMSELNLSPTLNEFRDGDIT